MPPAFLHFVYAIQAILDAAPGREPLTNIPTDMLRGIQLHVIVPNCMPVDDDSIPLILRFHLQSEDVVSRIITASILHFKEHTTYCLRLLMATSI